jgi:cysteine-rich repeat protein
MKTIRTLNRFLSLGFCVAAISACNPDSDASTGSDGATGTESEGSDTTVDPTNTTGNTTKTSQTDATSDPTEGGSMTGTGETTPTEGTTAEGTTDGTTGPVTATDTDGPAVCGNGVVEGTEECDGDVEGVLCEDDCTLSPPVCGNMVVEVGELCDDGNTDDGDECSADCTMVTVKAMCGNGVVEDAEECDDGNQDAGDGCENDCTISPPVCGNMVVEGDEACDDGNDVNGGPGDFCKNDCTVFVPASCNAPPAKDYIVCDTGLETANKNDKTIAHKAMGICSDQANNSVVLSPGSFSFTSTNNAAWQVAKGFGTYQDPKNPGKLLYSPREGDTFLMVSTGVIKAPNNQGVVIETNNSQGGNGDNGNDDGNALPAPFQSKKGSANGAGNTPFQNCDGVNDCSDTLAAQWQLGGSNPNDKLWFTFKTKVPEGTFGYRFDFVFCSSEWPSWVNTGYNDLLISWQTDPSADDPNADPPVDPYTGNVTFIPNPNDPAKGLPLTITALDPYFDGPGYSGNEPQLAGTGFETHACTDWFTAKGGVQPGAEVTIGFFIADMSDSILATMAILDNFRWDCEGCVPSEVDDCGVQQPQ